jgi:hypothetical protein
MLEGLTPEELRLAENIDTRDWRARYQPQGVGFRNHPLPEPRGTAGAAGLCPYPSAAAGGDPCAESLCEAGQ